MIYKCKFIETHQPVFFNGKNYGTKLDSKLVGVELFWDADFDKTYMMVKGNKNPCIMGTYHVLEPIDFEVLPAELKAKPVPKAKVV